MGLRLELQIIKRKNDSPRLKLVVNDMLELLRLKLVVNDMLELLRSKLVVNQMLKLLVLVAYSRFQLLG